MDIIFVFFKILQNLIIVDKQDNQGDLVNFGMGHSIDINIRRNFIYEDAFEKLSPENGKFALSH